MEKLQKSSLSYRKSFKHAKTPSSYRFDLWEFYLIRKLYGHWEIWIFSSHVENSFSTFKEKSLCSHACKIFYNICELILTMLLHRLVLLETLAGHQGISGLSVTTGHWTHIHVVILLVYKGSLDKNLNRDSKYIFQFWAHALFQKIPTHRGSFASMTPPSTPNFHFALCFSLKKLAFEAHLHFSHLPKNLRISLYM